MTEQMNGYLATASLTTENSSYDAIAQWEDELDMLGAFASLRELEVHLALCPNGAPSKSYLEGHIAARKLKM